MRENLKSGSVRGVKQPSMVEYCDTPHIEREEKQGIQSIPKEGGYDVYSTRSDIDLVVEGLSPDLYMKALTESWDFLPAGIELNLVPFEGAFESLKKKTLKEGDLIYG